MKKIIALCMAAVLAACLFGGCGAAKAEFALVVDAPTVDDGSFNRAAWEGLVRYTEEKKRTHAYYTPKTYDEAGYAAAVAAAVKDGAKVVVLPGGTLAQAAAQAQSTYPEISFVLLDDTPKNADGTEAEQAKNLVSVQFADEQAGFLAGYAAVKEGYTSLGFLGGEVQAAVVRYGYGFVQGADWAAVQMGLAPGSVTIRYGYTGSFSADAATQQIAAGWYQEGTQCIFACAGGGGASVMAAADAAGGKVIGVDVDQSGQSTSVVNSAVKGLGNAVYDMLTAYEENTFPGGQVLLYDVTNNGVGLVMDQSKFTQFARADYDDLYAKLAGNTDNITSNIKKTASEDGMPSTGGVVAQVVQVQEIAQG